MTGVRKERPGMVRIVNGMDASHLAEAWVES